MSIYSDFQGYFDTVKPGTTIPFAEGTLFLDDTGRAEYKGPGGSNISFTKDTPLQDIYSQNPFIATAWSNTYGYDPLGLALQYNPLDMDLSSIVKQEVKPTELQSLPYVNPNPVQPTSTSTVQPATVSTGQPAPVQALPSTLDIPTDAYPSSSSSSSNQSTSSSKTGINWESPVAAGLLDSLLNSGNNLQTYTDNLGKSLQNQYQNMLRQAMNPANFQGVLNSLSNRRVLNSDIASDTMSKFASAIASDIANKNFEAQVQQAQAQMQVPTILANLMSLGNESTSQSQSTGQSQSESSDKSALYQILANLLSQ